MREHWCWKVRRLGRREGLRCSSCITGFSNVLMCSAVPTSLSHGSGAPPASCSITCTLASGSRIDRAIPNIQDYFLGLP